ncbi:MAG: outer membrane beta-barrel protein [Nitrospirales bacterium]
MFDMRVGLVLMVLMLVPSPSQGEGSETIEMYLAGYGMTTQPSNKGISFKGMGVSDERVDGDPGLGLKVGFFPYLFRGYLGVELEAFGQNNSMSFPVGGSGMSTTKGESSLIAYSSMLNLLFRYPGRYARPFVGIGGGLSNGVLHHVDIPGRKDRSVEMDSALGYQFLGGVQLVVAKNWFIFGEYKYSAAHYHWNQLSLNFRGEHFLGGVGYNF